MTDDPARTTALGADGLPPERVREERPAAYQRPPSRPYLRWEKFIFGIKTDDRIALLEWLASESGCYIMRDLVSHSQWFAALPAPPTEREIADA